VASCGCRVRLACAPRYYPSPTSNRLLLPHNPPSLQEENGLMLDVELTGPHLREVVRRFKVRLLVGS